jgi:8-oxo-dGTP diphosphatase
MRASGLLLGRCGMAKVWVTGFQPFGKHTENISGDIARSLIGQSFDVEIESSLPFDVTEKMIEIQYGGEVLSVDEKGSVRTSEILRDELPDAIIHLGLKEDSVKINLELCAINECDFRIKDNAGRQLKNTPVIESALPLLHTTSHAPTLRQIAAKYADVEISEDCGKFVCNETYFRTLNSIERDVLLIDGRPIPALFIHLPHPEQISIVRQKEVINELSVYLVQKPTVQVVGAIAISDDNRILACRRSPTEVMGGLWEFPGGKVEFGETEQSALKRELKEELELNVEIGKCLARESHDYGSMIVNLAFYECKVNAAGINLSVHDSYRWLDEDESGDLEWLPADVGVVGQLAEKGFGNLG